MHLPILQTIHFYTGMDRPPAGESMWHRKGLACTDSMLVYGHHGCVAVWPMTTVARPVGRHWDSKTKFVSYGA